MMVMFLNHPGEALSRDTLLNAVWGSNFFGDVKTLDVHVRRLREKIEEDPSNPRYIETVWGHGYRWNKGT
jgi:DNA-binding response OmpR family regulator